MSPVRYGRHTLRCCQGDGLPSGEEQYFSQFGDRHASVFMQSKAQFFLVFHRGAQGTMRCYKVCLMFADPAEDCPLSSAQNEHAVWVVEVKPVQAIMSIMTTIVISIAYEECIL